MAGKTGNAQYTPVSLYPEHVKAIKSFKEKNGFKTDSAALQDMIEYHQRTYKKSFFKNLMLFIVYPMIITFVLNRIANIIFDSITV